MFLKIQNSFERTKEKFILLESLIFKLEGKTRLVEKQNIWKDQSIIGPYLKVFIGLALCLGELRASTLYNFKYEIFCSPWSFEE